MNNMKTTRFSVINWHSCRKPDGRPTRENVQDMVVSGDGSTISIQGGISWFVIFVDKGYELVN